MSLIDLKYKDMSLNLTVPWYLMAAYAYYEEDDPIINDITFDNLAKYMLANWKHIKHIHKKVVTKKDLEAGTFLGKYPSRVEASLKHVRTIKYDRFTVYKGLPFE